MFTQDEYGNAHWIDPYAHSDGMSFSERQFNKVKPKKIGPYIENLPPSNPETDNQPDLLSRLKAHYDQFTSDPFAWATDNPWKAAGGMGALTAALYSLSGNNQNNGNNGNNGGGFNLVNGILPSLGIAALTYGAIKGIPWLKQQFKDFQDIKARYKDPYTFTKHVVKGAVDDGKNAIKGRIKELKNQLQEEGRAQGEYGMQDVRSNMDKRVGKPIVPVTPKIIGSDGKTVTQGIDSQGRPLVRREEDVAKGWKPVKDANGNIIRYEETNKSIWDRFMDFKRGMYD